MWGSQTLPCWPIESGGNNKQNKPVESQCSCKEMHMHDDTQGVSRHVVRRSQEICRESSVRDTYILTTLLHTSWAIFTNLSYLKVVPVRWIGRILMAGCVFVLAAILCYVLRQVLYNLGHSWVPGRVRPQCKGCTSSLVHFNFLTRKYRATACYRKSTCGRA